MKKFMFAAIATVAFCAAGNAETVGDENPCKETFGRALTYAASQGLSADNAWQYASVVYYFCENNVDLTKVRW